MSIPYKPCNLATDMHGHGCTRIINHEGACDHNPAIAARIEQSESKVKVIEPTKVLTGGLTSYYLVRVDHPQRAGNLPYIAECEDIIEALALNPDEANIFKEIWRSANARQGNGKPDHKALYGAEKIVHYAGRILRRLKRQS